MIYKNGIKLADGCISSPLANVCGGSYAGFRVVSVVSRARAGVRAHQVNRASFIRALDIADILRLPARISIFDIDTRAHYGSRGYRSPIGVGELTTAPRRT